MAMPASGCIALRTCITGCACSSISCAVAGFACSPACLSSLSVQAGKSAPHSMSEFYGYAPAPTTFKVYMNVCYYGSGDCMDGMAYLRCCNGVGYCNCYFSTNSDISFTWTNIPSGCYYVDMSGVMSYVASNPVLTSYYWCDDFNSGSGACNDCFSGENYVSFDVYDM